MTGRRPSAPASPLVTALALALREVADRKARERAARRGKLTVVGARSRRGGKAA